MAARTAGRNPDIARRAGDRDGAEHHEEEDERERAGGEREHREEREPDEAPVRDRNERGEREREPEPVRERGGHDRGGGDDGEEPRHPRAGLAPGTADDEAEGGRRRRDADHREEPDPDERGERVVDEAVADERVAPGVPVVRPEREAVLEVDVELEDVRGEVGAGRREPDDQGGERARQGRVLERLAGSEVRQRQSFSETACPGPPDRNPTFRACLGVRVTSEWCRGGNAGRGGRRRAGSRGSRRRAARLRRGGRRPRRARGAVVVDPAGQQRRDGEEELVDQALGEERAPRAAARPRRGRGLPAVADGVEYCASRQVRPRRRRSAPAGAAEPAGSLVGREDDRAGGEGGCVGVDAAAAAQHDDLRVAVAAEPPRSSANSVGGVREGRARRSTTPRGEASASPSRPRRRRRRHAGAPSRTGRRRSPRRSACSTPGPTGSRSTPSIVCTKFANTRGSSNPSVPP